MTEVALTKPYPRDDRPSVWATTRAPCNSDQSTIHDQQQTDPKDQSQGMQAAQDGAIGPKIEEGLRKQEAEDRTDHQIGQ